MENQEKLGEAGFFRASTRLFQELRFTFRRDGGVFRHYNAQLLRLKGLAGLLVTSVLEGRSGNDPVVKAVSSEVSLRDVGFLVAYSYFAFTQLMGAEFSHDA